MDDLRNRGPHPHPHHHHGFPRMANWMSAGDADDGGMADLASRMAHSNWPLSSMSAGRRGGPWRERRGSGGSAMSATSEDDSSYDAAVNDKSSQGSGGSGGLDAVSHEIPIMIEAEAPPSMMPQQQQQSYSNHSDHTQQQQPPSGPELPLVGQLRKSPQYATRTSSACEGGNPPEQLRATRCVSAPPQMLDQAGGDGGGGGGVVGSSPNNRFISRATVTPQARSATVPISPHNNVAKPFVATYKSSGTPRGQDPIIEESPQQQQTQQQQQQEQYPQQEYYQPQQQHPQQQWSNQPYYHQQQQHPYPSYDDPWQQYYANDPRSFDEDQYYQQQQPHLQHQRPSVVRNIPIFIEGQNSPIINEDKPSFSSSPRNVPPVREHQQQQQHFQQDPNWNQQQQFFRNSPPTFGNVPYQSQQQYQPSQHYYQQQQHPQPTQQQQHDHQHQQQQSSPQQKQHHQPQTRHQKPVHQQQQQQQDHTLHEIPIQHEQPPPQRQPSPQPQPPPVKLTPLQRIDLVRANNEEFMKRADEFRGTKKDRNFLYLDEMLTRALISLDDIDPAGNDEIRQARKALVRDINAKLSLLEKTASAAMSSNATEVVGKVQAICENGETLSPKDKKEIEVTADDETSRNPQPESHALEKTSCVTEEPKSDFDTKTESLKTEVQSGEAESSHTPSVQTDDCAGPIKEAIPCPAPAIPLPEK